MSIHGARQYSQRDRPPPPGGAPPPRCRRTIPSGGPSPPGSICGENRVQEMTAHLDDDAYEGARSTSSATSRPTRSSRWWAGWISSSRWTPSRLLEAIDSQAAKLGLVRTSCWRSTSAARRAKGAVRRGQELARLARRLAHVRLRGLDGHPSRGPEPGGNRPFFCKNASAFC